MSDITDKLKTAGKTIGSGISWTVFPLQKALYNAARYEDHMSFTNSLLAGALAGGIITTLVVNGFGGIALHDKTSETALTENLKLTKNYTYNSQSLLYNLFLGTSPVAYIVKNIIGDESLKIPLEYVFEGKDIITFEKDLGYQVDKSKIETILYYDNNSKEYINKDDPKSDNKKLIEKAESTKNEIKTLLEEGNLLQVRDLETEYESLVKKISENSDNVKSFINKETQAIEKLETEVNIYNNEYFIKKVRYIKWATSQTN